MKSKKIIALVLSTTLFLTYFNTIAFAKNINLHLNQNVLVENKEEFNYLKDTVIQVNDLKGFPNQASQKFTALAGGIFKIKFDEENKKLKVFDIKSSYFSTLTNRRDYFILKILDESWRVKKEIKFIGEDLTGWGKEEEINDFEYEYGDIISLWGATKETINIHGKIIGLPSDYPYIMPNRSNFYNFQITKDGLKAIDTSLKVDENLESNVISVKSEFLQLSPYSKKFINDSNAFKITFDENTKEIKVINRRDDYYLKSYLIIIPYFKIEILDKNKNEKLNLTIYNGETGTSKTLDKLHNFHYEYGDIIKIWCVSPKRMSILGNVLNASADYSKGMLHIKNIKELDELAFEVTPKGLKEIRNESPEIIGAEDITIRKGIVFDKMENVIAKDDNDGDVTRNLTVIGDVDINKVGGYKLTYRVADSKNKITEKIRNVNVIEVPELEKNKIKVLGLSSNEKFKIEFDDIKKQFKIKERANEQIHIYFNKKEYFSFCLLDRNYNEKLKITLNGDDLGTSNKLEQLENFTYEYGDIIKLHHVEPGRLKITGNILDKKEDYSDGVNNRDNLENVYFQITKQGLRSIYNAAPIILGINNVTLKVGDSFNPLDGISVSDDYDNNLVPTVKGNIDLNTAGNYSLIYTVKDSMGREVSATRNIIVKTNEKPILNGLTDITIKARDSFDKLLGVTANDKEDGDLISKISVKGNVNIAKEGIYTLVYSVTDSDGNIVTKSRNIQVRSNTKPKITGTENSTILVGSVFD